MDSLAYHFALLYRCQFFCIHEVIVVQMVVSFGQFFSRFRYVS